jgi:hypothetical protein
MSKPSQAWSYSSIKTFEQCPKKYYHLKIAKDVKDEGGQASIYGNLVHKAAEDYVRDGTPMPPEYSYMVPVLDALLRIPGEKHCELKLGVGYEDNKYYPTDFSDPDAWWRGIADLLVVDSHTAYLVDYKTGKNAKYADPTQLDMLAGAVFTHMPWVTKIKSGLLYVVSGEFIKKEHTAKNRTSYLATFDDALERLVVAEKVGVWNPVSGPLCKFCPVVSCAHNRKR